MFFFMIPIISKLCPIIRTFKWGIPVSRLPGYSGRSSVRQPWLSRFHSGRISAGNSSPTCRGRGLLADFVKSAKDVYLFFLIQNRLPTTAFLSASKHNTIVTVEENTNERRKLDIIPTPVSETKYWHKTTTGK